MNRREALGTLGTLALTSTLGAGSAAARQGKSEPKSDYFLSPTNPLATSDQRELTALALRVMQMPAVQKMRPGIAAQWRAVSGPHLSEQARAQFDSMIDEYLFINVLKAVNADPNYPRVLGATFTPPHEWFGLHVPGSRVAGPNPDNSYRQIPLDPHARYELIGQRFDPAPADFGFTLMSNLMFTRPLPLLARSDVKIESDGSFRITLGPEPAKGRANHLQMPAAARWLFVRDSRSDWKQIANGLQVRRLDAPRARPRTEEEIAELAAAVMIEDLPNSFWWMRVSRQSEPNAMTQPDNTGGVGGLATQQTSFGQVTLADDEALIVKVSPGGAAYRSLVIYDYWYRCLDPALHMSSMNNAQSVPSADGTITHVISSHDPGVFNWLDAAGQNELLLLHRWQGLPRERSEANRLVISTQLVKLDDLDRVLPRDIQRVSATERTQQVEQRRAAYLRRYLDH